MYTIQTNFLRRFYTFSIFDDYFETVKQINSENGGSARRRVLLIQAFLFFFILFLVTVALVSDQLPILVQLALNNLFFFESIPAGHLSWLITIICLLMYLNILLYLCNDGVTFSVLYSIIASKNSHCEVDRFFLQSSPDNRLFRSDISLVQFFRGRLLPFGRLFVRASNFSTSKYPAILLARSP